VKRNHCLPPTAALLLLLLTNPLAWCDEPKVTSLSAKVPEGVLTAGWLDGDVLLLYGTRSANGLGIDVVPAEAALRAQLGLKEDVGLVVTSAAPETIGAKAGLKQHDVLVRVGDEKVGDLQRLSELLESADGKAVKLHVLRGGKPLQIEAMPKKPQQLNISLENFEGLVDPRLVTVHRERYRIGVHLAEADDTLRAHLRLAQSEGLVVTGVVNDSAATQAGIQEHDVLTVLDGKRVTTVEAVNAQIQEIKDRQVELRLLRGGKEITFQLAPRKSNEASYEHMMGFEDMAGGYGMADGYDGKKTGIRAVTLEAMQGGDLRQQISIFKRQLGQMQKTLTALESTLTSEESSRTEEKKE
jgi:C-terminal processing protease CtpA/Prc